ncbi:MAG: universal stress protein [Oculatellaceae cyanobacterium bins.114]|nr:universal stress protein [Oculatellaceae cyanobacterium bins.114]
MAQLSSSDLHLPLLLAANSPRHADVGQQWLQPIANLLTPQSDAHPLCSILAISGESASCLNPVSESYADAPSLQPHPGRSALPILDYAQAVQAGLLGFTWRSPNTSKQRAEEDVSEDVGMAIARYAPCPVLVIRDAQEGLREPSWNHVLLVVNASDATKGAMQSSSSDGVIGITRQLIPAGIRHITILCIQPPLNPHYLFGPFATRIPNWQLTQSLRQAQYEQSQSIALQTKTALNLPDGAVQTLIQISDSGSLICNAAQHHQADVIIMGSDTVRRLPIANYHSHRRDRLTPLANYVIHHSPCPVLLCRSRPSTANSSTANSSASNLSTSRAKRFALPKLKLPTTAMAKPR